MSPEQQQQQGLAVLGMASQLPAEQQEAFKLALDRIQSAVKEGGDAGKLALAYVGILECQE